jgi:SAM-dependent methyltransferase
VTELPLAALPPELAPCFAAWVEAAAARTGLTLREVRGGVRALSARYVEGRERTRSRESRERARSKAGRERAGDASPTLASAGLRAAFASYYAPLHFLTAFAAASALPAAWRSGIRQVVDLGAGTGAVAAALALACGAERVLAIDRAGWALGEARHSFAALGVAGRTRRAELPAGVPRLGRGDLVSAGFVLNECTPALRERLLGLLARALVGGSRVIVLEPLARGAAPWWEDAAARLAPAGAHAALHKWRIERPDWIARLDSASGLDHREIGARVLFGPGEEAPDA